MGLIVIGDVTNPVKLSIMHVIKWVCKRDLTGDVPRFYVCALGREARSVPNFPLKALPQYGLIEPVTPTGMALDHSRIRFLQSFRYATLQLFEVLARNNGLAALGFNILARPARHRAAVLRIIC